MCWDGVVQVDGMVLVRKLIHWFLIFRAMVTGLKKLICLQRIKVTKVFLQARYNIARLKQNIFGKMDYYVFLICLHRGHVLPVLKTTLRYKPNDAL